MTLKISKKSIWLSISFVILLLQQALLKYSSGAINTIIGYFDEILVLILLGLIIIYLLTGRKFDKLDSRIWKLFIIYTIIGIISNLLHQIQSTFYYVSDALVCSKFIICYLSMRIIVRKPGFSEKIIKSIIPICKLITIITLTLSVLNLFLIDDLFPKYEFRYFTNSLTLFYPHPTYLAIASITIAAVMMCSMFVNHNKKDIMFVYINLFCAVMSLRSKAIASAACILFLYFYFIEMKLKSKYIAYLLAVVVSIYIGFDQLLFYFGAHTIADSNFVRARLLRDSITIANSYFPFGSGFATFGSNIANTHFSELYTQYGYIEGTSYLSDSFWPIVIAQTGWIGTFVFICMIYVLFIKIRALFSNNKLLFWSCVSILIYMVIASIGETAFFNPACCPLFILIGLVMNVADDNNVKKKETS